MKLVSHQVVKILPDILHFESCFHLNYPPKGPGSVCWCATHSTAGTATLENTPTPPSGPLYFLKISPLPSYLFLFCFVCFMHCDDLTYIYIVKGFVLLTHPSSLLTYLLSFLWKHLNFTLSKFQFFNTVLSTIVFMFCIKSSGLTHSRAETVPFHQPIPVSPAYPPALGNPFSTLLLWIFLY